LASRSRSRRSSAPRKHAETPIRLAARQRSRLAGRTRLRARRGEPPRLATFLLIAAFAWLTGAHAQAADAVARARFDEARAAFDAEDFPRALALYEQALAAGIEGPAIHYNIGVAAFRSGDFVRAETAFREAARTPAMADLAHYNLGLVARERGDTRAAREWFERVRGSADTRLAALAARHLDELPAPPRTAWSYYLRGSAGYDDNVALRSDSIETTGSGDDDSFADLLFAGSYSFGAWRADVAAGRLDYFSLDEFDQSALSAGIARGFPLDAWYLELGAYGTQLSLGGDVYERSAAAVVRASSSFGQGHVLRAQFRFNAVDGRGDFDGLTGSRSELGATYEWSRRAWTFTARARGEINDSEDDAFASRWFELGAEAGYALSPRWSLSGGVALRRTRHPGLESTDPAESTEPWTDSRRTYELAAARTLWKQSQLLVRYEHERNSSPVEGYDYDRNWIAVSIEFWR
jgi:tetratricopeptide (TPR) repeat protein